MESPQHPEFRNNPETFTHALDTTELFDSMLSVCFRNQLFPKIEKFLHEYHQCQSVWIQIRPIILSDLIWFQTVCNGYQLTTLVSRQPVKE